MLLTYLIYFNSLYLGSSSMTVGYNETTTNKFYYTDIVIPLLAIFYCSLFSESVRTKLLNDSTIF